jgi:hypothetical protein
MCAAWCRHTANGKKRRTEVLSAHLTISYRPHRVTGETSAVATASADRDPKRSLTWVARQRIGGPQKYHCGSVKLQSLWPYEEHRFAVTDAADASTVSSAMFCWMARKAGERIVYATSAPRMANRKVANG